MTTPDPTVSAPDLCGLWVPVVTPLADDGTVDQVSLARLARRLLADGCRGLVALGTTGEAATLNRHERRLVVETCAAACREADRPLMVGAGSNCTRSSGEEIARWAELVAPAAVLVVVPYYTRPSEAGVIAHFSALADATSTPIVVYNVPYRTGRPLGADALVALARLGGVAGVKQAVGALDSDTLEVLARRPPSFQLLAGDDDFIAPTILMGGSGAIAAAAHACTPAFVALVAAAGAGDSATAAALGRALLPVVTAGFAEPNPAVWKALLHARGEIASPALRLPMAAASPAALDRIRAAVLAAEAHLAPA